MGVLKQERSCQGSSIGRARLSGLSDSATWNIDAGEKSVPGAAEESCYLKVGQGDKDAAAPSCFRPVDPRAYARHAAWAWAGDAHADKDYRSENDLLDRSGE